jgi:hypothetical protein
MNGEMSPQVLADDAQRGREAFAKARLQCESTELADVVRIVEVTLAEIEAYERQLHLAAIPAVPKPTKRTVPWPVPVAEMTISIRFVG